MKVKSTALFFTLVFSHPCIAANAMTANATGPVYPQAPETVRQFLITAKVADTIIDPLQRCLAYPDTPDNQWPTGLAKAHCELVFGPRITLEQIRDHIDRGALTDLDALFAADLAKHFSSDHFSEVIHKDFAAFDSSDESDRISGSWLKKAPASAYALTARAEYYRDMAWTARGGKYAADTPVESMKRMSEYAGISADLYKQALKIEPRLMQAYVGLVDLGRVDSNDDIEQYGWVKGNAVDPGCKYLTGYRMLALTPRWGGSHPEMMELSAQIANRLPERPLLALNTIWPFVDMADGLNRTEKYDDALRTLEPAIAQSSHPELLESMAEAILSKDGDAKHWEALMYLLEASRFRPGQAYYSRQRGRLLLYLANEPEWAIASLKQSVEDDADVAESHYLLATAYFDVKRYSDAEPEYLKATKDKQYMEIAMSDLINTLVLDKQFTKSREYVDLFNQQFPSSASGWMFRARILTFQKQPGVFDALRKFVETANPRDPNEMAASAQVQLELQGIPEDAH